MVNNGRPLTQPLPGVPGRGARGRRFRPPLPGTPGRGRVRGLLFVRPRSKLTAIRLTEGTRVHTPNSKGWPRGQRAAALPNSSPRYAGERLGEGSFLRQATIEVDSNRPHRGDRSSHSELLSLERRKNGCLLFFVEQRSNVNSECPLTQPLPGVPGRGARGRRFRPPLPGTPGRGGVRGLLSGRPQSNVTAIRLTEETGVHTPNSSPWNEGRMAVVSSSSNSDRM